MKKLAILSSFLLLSLFSCSIVPSSSNSSSTKTSVSEDEDPISMPSPVTNPDSNYDANSSTIITLVDNGSIVNNNNGYAVVDGNKIYITGEGTYDFSGSLSDGQIVVNPESEEVKIYINLQGVNISCSTGACIAILNGDKTEISAKNGYENYLYDNRTSDEDNLDLTKGVIHAYTDLEIKGKGYLEVESNYNNGISTTKDLEIKNLTLKTTAPNNALKGNDSLTIESGNITAISTLGDALKTDHSDISSKGNQRGNITIMGGELNLYAACDAIDASYNVDIYNEPVINIFTENYSSYSGVVSETSDGTLYLKVSSSSNNRPGSSSASKIDTSSVYFAAYYTLSDSTSVWKNATQLSSSGGVSRSAYFSIDKPNDAQKVQFYCFDNTQTEVSTETYKYRSENLTVPTSQDMYSISSISNSSLSGSWGNYTTTSTGGFGGALQEGNPDASTYSCKGIKADNEIFISNGTISISSHDDAIHANSDTLLETGSYGMGNVSINGGIITIISDDDGIHADNELNITGGEIKVNKSYEGLEGYLINIIGGNSYIMASDDGINASSKISISGGTTYFEANGDVIDSNGSIEMNGGVVFAQGPSSGGNGLLDFDVSFTFSGGLLLGFGTSDMAQKPTASGQATVTTKTSSISSGYITVLNGSTIIAAMKINMSNLSYAVLGYGSSYGSNLSISSSSSISGTLINNSYYIA